MQAANTEVQLNLPSHPLPSFSWGCSSGSAGPLGWRTSHVAMSYLNKDILVFGEDGSGEEVLNGAEVQDLVADGHTDPRSWLGGRWLGQRRAKPQPSLAQRSRTSVNA